MTYPVQLDVTSPPRFDRVQVLLRLVVAIALGWLGITAGWLTCLVFVAVPAVAAIVVSTRGPAIYLDQVGPTLWRALGWLLAFAAYMLLVVDRFPVGEPTGLRLELRVTGQPTTSSALLRLVTSIPSALVLGVLGLVSQILFVAGAVVVLVDGRVPDGILGFQRGVLRWTARLFAYHGSLVEGYPPFSFDESHAQPGDRASMV